MTATGQGITRGGRMPWLQPPHQLERQRPERQFLHSRHQSLLNRRRYGLLSRHGLRMQL